MISSENVFSLLSVKDGMRDSRYFVGREVLLSLLDGCVVGEQRSPAWIYGSRRIGKSTIAHAILRKAKADDTLVIYIDAIDIPSDGIDNAFKRVCDIASKTMRLGGGDNVRKSFEEIASSSSIRPVLIIFDEFDKIALSLKVDDQAFLRRLATDYDRFCYLFITRLPPTNIVEEFPDISSRILGICTMQKVLPLEYRDIKKICSKVSQDLHINKLKGIYNIIWEYTAGFPVAVTSILKRIAVLYFHKKTVSDEDIDDAILSSSNELKIDLENYWNTLSSETRSVLLNKCQPKNYIIKLKEDGLYNRDSGPNVPKLLLKISDEKVCDLSERDLKSNEPDNITNFLCLFKLISDINQSLQCKGYTDGFYIGTRTTEFYKILREDCDEAQFAESIDYLYLVFFEGARTKKGPNKEYRLPDPLDNLYKKTKVIGDISNLRNFLRHDQTSDTDYFKANHHFKEIGEIYKKYCGYKSPETDEHRLLIINNIIKEIISLVTIVYKKVQTL